MKKDFFKDSKIKFPAYEPWISKEDKKIVNKALSQSMLTLGPQLEKFESDFCKYSNSKYAIAVSNCTAALHLSLTALGIEKNDEVIIPDLTFVADANAILACNAKPVIVDINKENFFLSISNIKKNITKKTKAIIPVHIYGQVCNIDEIMDVANAHNLKVIEDCAHAIGTFHKSKHVGTLGNTGCFSFYPTKNITTAEGGMVITNSKQIAEKVRQLRSHGMTKSLKNRYSSEYPWIFDIIKPGYNYRLDEIRAALGITQLKRIKKINQLRKKASLYYHKNLQNIPGIILPDMVNDQTHSYHLYTIRVTLPYKLSRNQLFKKLKDNGIRTTVYWMPIHKYTAYQKFAKKSNVVNTTKIYDEILALPLFPNISKTHQDNVINVINSS
ncbi:MAG: UDP-4-amino-4,6-dideoxy-N-acetyl-beta-L-altrosamine transaminase [Thaumarchaeota archaeon]|jgi:dTDP-4-amino-4,6-dideoxygalactose transaminase|nr:MAG: UDP-4-amino-4,6-dideoxy-N-acetyl-beta-L-altrosamine transaminase [Nitrososphaerota archaeon]